MSEAEEINGKNKDLTHEEYIQENSSNEKIDKKVVINCIESMPKRCAEVIKNHGGSTKY